MHTILITNDDGIMADGLYRLAKEAQHFGRVYIVAPEGQRSAASHSITLHGTIDVFPYEYPLNCMDKEFFQNHRRPGKNVCAA